MHILILSGSRNPQGQTGRAVAAFAEGLSGAGAQHEVVFLPEKRIERCRQCDAGGWGTCRTERRCCIEDDFAEIVEQVCAADAIALATPVYFGDLSESLRGFLDRLRRISWQGNAGIAGKPVMGICVAGGGGGGAVSCCAQLEKILGHCKMDVVDLVPARRQNLEMKLGMLKQVGRWFAAAPTSTPAVKA